MISPLSWIPVLRVRLGGGQQMCLGNSYSFWMGWVLVRCKLLTSLERSTLSSGISEISLIENVYLRLWRSSTCPLKVITSSNLWRVIRWLLFVMELIGGLDWSECFGMWHVSPPVPHLKKSLKSRIADAENPSRQFLTRILAAWDCADHIVGDMAMIYVRT